MGGGELEGGMLRHFFKAWEERRLEFWCRGREELGL